MCHIVDGVTRNSNILTIIDPLTRVFVLNKIKKQAC